VKDILRFLQGVPRRLSFTLTLFTAVPCAHVRLGGLTFPRLGE